MSLRVNPHQATDPQAPLGPSPAIWADCPVLDLMTPTQNMGWFIREGWERVQQRATMVTTQNSNGYYPFLDGGSTITGNTTTTISAATNGLRNYLSFTGDAGDDDQASLQYAGMTDTPTGIIDIDTGHGKMWFETIISTTLVTDGGFTMLAGLRDITATANTDMADSELDIADIDFVGFAVWHDDGNSLDAIYQTTGSAFGTVTANAGTLTAGAATVAGAWCRLGITFEDPMVHYWINGAKVGSVNIATAGFPNGEVLTPFWLVKNGDAVAYVLNTGWWQAAQLY
jgi:hypothetical protein